MARRVSAAPNALLVLDGKSSPKLREPSSQSIDAEQIATFFVTLTETCNVVRSAKAAGFSANWAYRKRKRDAAFRNGWAEAVREGYARLELVLLERAIKGTPKLVRTAKGSDRVMREYSNALAIALLKRHAELAESASYEPPAAELAEIRERILERLDRVRERDGGELETKGAQGRLAVIARALREVAPPPSPDQVRGWSPSPATAGEDR